MSEFNPYTFSSSPVNDRDSFARAVGQKPFKWEPVADVAAPKKHHMFGDMSLGEERYRGHYRPIDFTPYGDKFQAEAEKAEAYNRTGWHDNIDSLAESMAFVQNSSPHLSRPEVDPQTLKPRPITQIFSSDDSHYPRRPDPDSVYNQNPWVRRWKQRGMSPEERNRSYADHLLYEYQNGRQPWQYPRTNSGAAWKANNPDYKETRTGVWMYDNEDFRHAAEHGYTASDHQVLSDRLRSRRDEGAQLYPMDYSAYYDPIPVFDTGDPATAGHYVNDHENFPGQPHIITTQETRYPNWENPAFRNPWFASDLDFMGLRRPSNRLFRQNRPGETMPARQLLEHELRHHPTLKATRSLEAEDPNIYLGLPEHASLLNEPLWDAVRHKGNLTPEQKLNIANQLHSTANHGLTPREQIGWMSGLQQGLFDSRGSRAETSEDARRILTELINDEDGFLRHTPLQNKEVLRGVRHLRRIKEMAPYADTPQARQYMLDYVEHMINILSTSMPSFLQNNNNKPTQPNPFTAPRAVA